MKFEGGYKILDNGTRIALERGVPNLSSNGVTKYSTLLWKDGTASCDCPGWTQRISDDGERSCKHTKDLRPRCPWIIAGHVAKVKENAATKREKERALAELADRRGRELAEARAQMVKASEREERERRERFYKGLDAPRRAWTATDPAPPAPAPKIGAPVKRAATRFDEEV